jgi:hypothetical protein
MSTRTQFWLLISAAMLCSLTYGCNAWARSLVSVAAPQHAPLFVDTDTVRRRGSLISFKYFLDVLTPSTRSDAPEEWKSNEIEATLDCGKRTVTVSRLTAYSGPGGTGKPTAARTFIAPTRTTEAIVPKSTFAYLEAHLCASR